MKRVWRFFVFWRYLLLACLVLAVAGDYLFVGLPHSADAPVPQSSDAPAAQTSSLRDKFEKIEVGMTESQVLELLGSPQRGVVDELMDTKVLTWQEGQDTIRIWVFWGKPDIVLNKDFFSRQEPLTYRGKP
jgi:hypothetical protein